MLAMLAVSTTPLDETLLIALRAAAAAAYPKEACGLLVRDASGVRYQSCKNTAGDQAHDRFAIDPEDWAAAEDAGEILAVVHSHPDACANPSTADRIGCERTGLPWLIVGWPSAVVVPLEPSGWEAPLIGREFAFGVQDCYTLIQDCFRRELQIELPDFEREDGFWERGEELYLENFEKAGFARVTGSVQPYDVVLMKVASDVVNHGAVYRGDGLILHHCYGRLSCRDPYGGYWLRHTHCVVRHRSRVAA